MRLSLTSTLDSPAPSSLFHTTSSKKFLDGLEIDSIPRSLEKEMCVIRLPICFDL